MQIESILIAIIAASPGLIALVGQLRKDAATSKKTSSEREQLEDEITEKVLMRANQELDKYISRIKELEQKLQDANLLIYTLQRRDIEREQAMSNLQEQFNRDALLRANIEAALRIANEKINELTSRLNDSQRRISQLEDELDKRDRYIADLKTKVNPALD